VQVYVSTARLDVSGSGNQVTSGRGQSVRPSVRHSSCPPGAAIQREGRGSAGHWATGCSGTPRTMIPCSLAARRNAALLGATEDWTKLLSKSCFPACQLDITVLNYIQSSRVPRWSQESRPPGSIPSGASSTVDWVLGACGARAVAGSSDAK
jgi:hypothetical protein